MRFKGQVELVVILALLVVITVVVVTQMDMIIPSGETPDVRTVRESAEGLIRTAVHDTIDVMSDHGGYLSDSYQLGSVRIDGKDVPYWQYRGQVTVPDKSANLQTGVQAYLEANKDSLAAALSEVSFGTPMVGPPSFSDDSITVTVTMPTTYRDAPISQPYIVTVPTHFGEIFEFSEGFAYYDANERPFEYYTLSSMMLSPLENGHQSIPFYEFFVGCGDHLFTSSWDIIPKVETTIEKTLYNTYMPGKAPLGTITTSPSPKYSLVPINNKEYQDIDPRFLLPDDFSLDHSNFRMTPDPATGIAEPIPLLGDCASRDALEFSYAINYPAIVSVNDPETGSVFRYAVDVYISDNQPAAWTASTPLDQDEDSICSEPSCILELDVEGSSGEPIQGATVGFMGCYLGKTDSTGYLATLAPCGAGTLAVDKNGYGSLLDSRTSAELSDTVTLLKRPQVNVLLYEVQVQDQGSGQYMIYYNDDAVKPVQNKRVYLTLRDQDTFQEYAFYPPGPSFSMSNVPTGDYFVMVNLVSMDFQTQYGGMAYSYTLDEDTSELSIYIPYTQAFSSLATDEERLSKIGDLTQVLDTCGIGPVSETGYSHEGACPVTIA